MYRIIKRRSRRSVKCLESAATAAATAVITAAVVAAGEEKDENDYDPDDVIVIENIAKAVVHSNLRFSVGDADLRDPPSACRTVCSLLTYYDCL